MIHEYRTYTITPGELNLYLELAETRVQPTRQDRYGRLAAFWTSEFGVLNQVHHIWEYASLDQRQALRRELSQNPTWCDDFLAGAWPTMQSQEVRFMLPQMPLADVGAGNVFYERRIYRCPAGKFAALCAAVMARPRSAQAKLFGVWVSETPQPNEIVEIVAYPGFGERLADATTTAPQRDWLHTHKALLQQIESTLLLPIGISPVQ